MERILSTCFVVSSDDGRILSAAQWSKDGCSKNENMSNASTTVCECDHLTHFAILLSASPLNLSASVLLPLQIMECAGVSVSLIAMTLTVITFIFLKYVAIP